MRQWTILRLLSESGRPWSVKELAEQLGTTKATIDRDLKTLEHDFALVAEEVGKQKKVWAIDGRIRALETVNFGTAELLAIYAAVASLQGLAGTPLHEDLERVIHKLRGFLAPRHNGGLDAMARVFAPHARGHVDYTPQSELIDTLVDAIARHLVCELVYQKPGPASEAARTHRARPLKLVWHRSALYVLACLGEHERITTLAVQRIRTLEVTGDTFAPPSVDVEEHVARAFGIFVSDQEEDVEVVFDAEIAWKLEERTYHPDEQKERLPDGRLRYRVRSSAQWEVIPWVQSFGPYAELVQPASWRAALAANVEAMSTRYR